MEACLEGIERDFPQEEYSLFWLWEKYNSFLRPGIAEEEKLAAMVKAATELTTQEAPRWEYIAARLLNLQFHQKLEQELKKRGI